MAVFSSYVKPSTLEEAYELIQKKNNVAVAGMMWTRLEDRKFAAAVDLSGLGLEGIYDEGEFIRIGAMTTLRQMEKSQLLNGYTDGAFRDCLSPIVGVQFRNMATVGGSVYGRYGFSDVITLLAALDSYVELYRGGTVPLHEYVETEKEKDIIVNILIKKEKDIHVRYMSQRNTSTDFPVLACCGVKTGDTGRITVGARPGRAKRDEFTFVSADDAAKKAQQAAEEMVYGSNLRAGAEYRKAVAGVLAERIFRGMEE